MDHRMRAPPHGFSQLAASFLACPRLGIPRVPLLRLTSSLLLAPFSQSSRKRPVHRYFFAYQCSSSFSTNPITRIVKYLTAPERQTDGANSFAPSSP